MLFSIFEQGASFIRKQARHKRWLVVCVCLALVAVSGTILALKLNGQAMTHKQKVLQCEYHVHEHVKSCYDQKTQELICGYADYVVHTHNVDCYNDNGALMCSLPEVKEHKHDKTCYKDQSVLTCTEAETAGHQHTDECYQTEQGELTCGMTEHTHDDACYDEAGEIACGMEEHQHSDSCYAVNSVLICGTEEGSGGHSHTNSCYETQTVLACGKLENHTHDEKACYDKDGNLTCKEIVLEEHVHNSDCFVTVELTAEEVAALNQPSPSPEVFFTEEEDSELEKEGSDVEENTADPEPGSGLEEDSSREDDSLVDFPLKKTAVLGSLTVTAGYYEKAEIPEEAELEVRLIAEENELGACLAAADEWITAKDKTWLYDIGFYLDGEEIQPEDTVYVTMQVAEDWLRVGTPVSVVHFVKDEPVLLEASALKEMEDGSFATEFDVETFSRFLLILGEAPREPEKTETVKTDYELSDTFDFETDDFTMTIRVDGPVTVETPAEDAAEKAGPEASDEEPVAAGLKAAPAEEPEEETEKTVTAAEPADEAENAAETEDAADEAAADTAEAEDSALEETGDGKLTAKDVDFAVELLDEDDPLYQAFEAALDAKAQETAANADKDEEAAEDSAAEASADEVSLLALSVMRFNFALDGTALDVSQCEITAEVTLKEQAFAAVEMSEDAAIEAEPSITLTAMEIVDEEKAIAEVETLETMAVSQSEIMPMMFSVNNGVMALSVEDATNFTYQVQYYANLNVLAKQANGTTAANTLPLIDTTGKNLPQNGTTPPIANLYLNTNGTVKREQELTKLFNDKTYNYKERPGLSYIEVLPSGNDLNYELEEVWVLKSGKDQTSTNKNDWAVYDPANIFITNTPGGTVDGKTRVVVTAASVIRMVYKPTTGAQNVSAAFYDYDISSKVDGNTMYTETQGINSAGNYSGSGVKLAFGNANTGTGLGYVTWSRNSEDNTLNKYNNSGYQGCTFQLVSGRNGDSPVFRVNAPALFGTTPAVGKHIYASGSSLTFSREGDTYTLSSVYASDGEVSSSISGLDKFEHPGSYSIWTNNFWPMDNIQNKDNHFGDSNKWLFVGTEQGKLPPSDDGKAHNSYFGMQYAIQFTMDEDYVGPLEYLFYGDDDMWVFLDDTLVADIGGVHRSVGEKVDLREWLTDENGKLMSGTHTMYVFYTERGASGSTCFMQFTLPSVKSLAPVAAYGDLEVSKTVDGPDTGDSFEFTLSLQGSTNTYTCNIFNKDGTFKESKSITCGGNAVVISLKNGEHFSVSGVHKGVSYTIKETSRDGYEPTVTVNGTAYTLNANGTVTGTVSGQSTVSVAYTNHTTRVLPETGGADVKPLYAIGGAVIFMGALLYGGGLWRKRKRKNVSGS